jgi:riboflavin biosynthesis pyrimidine reductase
MILTTKSTLYADKPKLNVRLDGKEYDKPVACISRHCMTSEEKDEITKFATEVCGIAKFEILDNFSIDTLRALASRGIIRILTEGGPNLVDSFYKEGFWNQFDLYIDSCVLPDDLLGWIKPLSLGQINSSQIFGSSIKLSYLKQ